MKLEEQVCSLELAKKLKELGIKQNKSHYCWNKQQYGSYLLGNNPNYNSNIIDECVSAFTVAELGEILPNCVLKPNSAPFDNYCLTIRKFISVDEKMKHTNNFVINYECDSTETTGADAWITRKLTRKFTMSFYDPNLANAMAKILIFLIEDKLLEVSSLHKDI